MSENWALLATCGNHLEARVMAGLLESESVQVMVRNEGAVPGLESGTQVLVPAALLHRARWLLAQALPTEAELTELATQQLPRDP